MTKQKNGNVFRNATLVFISILCVLSLIFATSAITNAQVGLSRGALLTGLNDEVESLYHVYFTDPNNLNEDISEIYVNSDSTVIMKGSASIATNNQDVVGTNVQIFGNIESNNSDNIAVLGGDTTTINQGNDYSTIRGGKGNSIATGLAGTEDNFPNVLVGGENNKIGGNQKGVVILGGKNNLISGNVINSQILGGESNVVNANNTVVAGANVNVGEGAGNSFVFSDGDGIFSPTDSDAFYLNLQEGLGLNGAASDADGLTVNGAVSIGYINIKEDCDEGRLGVQGSYDGCIFGCTQPSLEDGHKWDLLSKSDSCIQRCNDDTIVGQHCRDIPEREIITTPAYCTGVLSTESVPCFSSELTDGIINKFQDTIFQIIYVPDSRYCPRTVTDAINPCIYACKPGTTASEGGCLKNCSIELVNSGTTETITLYHGQSIDFFSRPSASCPETCKYSNQSLYPNNQYTATCNNGTLEYTHMTKATGIISANESDFPTKYALCSDQPTINICPGYTLNSGDVQEGWISDHCDSWILKTDGAPYCIPDRKFKFSGCQDGYTQVGTGDSAKCYKKCPLPWAPDDMSKAIDVGDTITGYNTQTVQCYDINTSCDGSAYLLKCGENGQFEFGSTYRYESCRLTEKKRNADQQAYYNQTACPPHGTCEEFDEYDTTGTQCTLTRYYHLKSCDDGYSLNTKEGVNNNWTACFKDCVTDKDKTVLKYGEAITGYKLPVPTCTQYCAMDGNRKVMKCDGDGVDSSRLDGNATYFYESCTTKDLKNKEGFNRLAPVENANCESWVPYSGYFNQCVAQPTTYKCTSCKDGYTLNGTDLVGGDVNSLCLKDCTVTLDSLGGSKTFVLDGWTGSDNSRINWTWAKNLYTCPESYDSNKVVGQCDNGTFVGERYWDGYQTGVVCQKINNSTIQTRYATSEQAAKNQIGGSGTNRVIAASVTQNGKTQSYCDPYTVNSSKQCVHGTTAYYLKCNDGYQLNSSSDKCIKCRGNIPSNAHPNNSKLPTTDDTVYYYSTDTNAACTFQCDNNYTRSSSEGRCLAPCIFADDGTIVPDGGTKIAYSTNSPVCDTTCADVRTTLICHDGHWHKDGYNYKGCSTKIGHKNNSDTSYSAGSCQVYDGSDSTKKKTFVDRTASGIAVTLVSTCTESLASSQTCNAGSTYRTYTCIGGTWSDNICNKNCTWNGTEYTHGQTVTAYNVGTCTSTTSTAPSGTLTCNNGSRTNVSSYPNVRPTMNSSIGSCTSDYDQTSKDPNGTYETCVGYTAGNSTNPPTCTAYNKYKMTGCKSGYTRVGNSCYSNCTLDGKSVAHNGSATFYSTNSTHCTQNCSDVAITAYCSNGVLYKDSSHTQALPTTYKSNCSYTDCDRCTTKRGTTISHGDSINGCKVSSVTCPSTCQCATMKCDDGDFTNSAYNQVSSCTLNSYNGCNNPGSDVKYSETTLSISNSIQSTCSNGSYVANNSTNTCTSKTYYHYTCKSGYHRNSGKTECIPDDCNTPCGTISLGGSKRCYNSSSVPCGSSCSYKDYTCTSSGLGTNSYDANYKYTSCSVGSCTCSSPCGTISNGGSKKCYNSSSVPCGSSCSYKNYTCSNGVLGTNSYDSNYKYTSCSVDNTTCSDCDKSLIPCATTSLAHGGKKTCYEPAPCTVDTCASITYTCNNGSVDKAYDRAYSASYCSHFGGATYDDYPYESCPSNAAKCSSAYIDDGEEECQLMYKIDSCKSGYTLVNGKCESPCTHAGKTINSRTSGTWYSRSSASNSLGQYCSSYSATAYCKDGTLYTSSTYATKFSTSTYPYGSCSDVGCGEPCDGFNLTSCPDKGTCSSCTPESTSCVKSTAVKRLDSCPSGYYKCNNNTMCCVTCPSGYENKSVTYPTSTSQCYKKVTAGYYVKTAGGSAVDCPSGTYSNEHNVSYGSTSTCTNICKSSSARCNFGSAGKNGYAWINTYLCSTNDTICNCPSGFVWNGSMCIDGDDIDPCSSANKCITDFTVGTIRSDGSQFVRRCRNHDNSIEELCNNCTYEFDSTNNRCIEEPVEPTGATCGSSAFSCSQGTVSNKVGSTSNHTAGATVSRNCDGIDYNGDPCTVQCSQTYYKTAATTKTTIFCGEGSTLVTVGEVNKCAPDHKVCAYVSSNCVDGGACAQLHSNDYGSSACHGNTSLKQDGILTVWPSTIDSSNWDNGHLHNGISGPRYSFNNYNKGNNKDSVSKECGQSVLDYWMGTDFWSIDTAFSNGCYFSHVSTSTDNGYSLTCPTSTYTTPCTETVTTPGSEGRNSTMQSGICKKDSSGGGIVGKVCDGVLCIRGYTLNVKTCECVPNLVDPGTSYSL